MTQLAGWPGGVSRRRRAPPTAGRDRSDPPAPRWPARGRSARRVRGVATTGEGSRGADAARAASRTCWRLQTAGSNTTSRVPVQVLARASCTPGRPRSGASIDRSRSGARRRPGTTNRTRPVVLVRTTTPSLGGRAARALGSACPPGSGASGSSPSARPLASSSECGVQRSGSNSSKTLPVSALGSTRRTPGRRPSRAATPRAASGRRCKPSTASRTRPGATALRRRTRPRTPQSVG